jgi:alpha-L-fucosidase
MALINNRIGLTGDFVTPEQRLPKGIPTKASKVANSNPNADRDLAVKLPAPADFQPWETCMTINGTWGYNKNDHRFKSTTTLVRALVDDASKGGNFLLNIGPTPEGTIQPEFVERLEAIGAWLKVNGEAIYGTTFGPLQDVAWGRSTAKGKTVYLFVFDQPKGALDVELPGVRAARLLAGNRPLKFTRAGNRISIPLDGIAADPHATVIALDRK